MAMNDWYLRSTSGIAVLAEERKTLIESWKKLIGMGVKQVYPAHGPSFPISVITDEISLMKKGAL